MARVRGCTPIEAYELAYPPRRDYGNRGRNAIAVEACRISRRPAVQNHIDRLQHQLADEIAVADPRVRLAEARILLRRIQDGRADRERGHAAVAALRDAERQLRGEAREERRLLNILISRPRLPLAPTGSRSAASPEPIETAPVPETEAAPVPPRSPLPASPLPASPLPASPPSPPPSPAPQTPPPLQPDETIAAHVRERQAAVHAPPEPPLGTRLPTYRGFGSGGSFPADGGRE
jgi:hypothetical protein